MAGRIANTPFFCQISFEYMLYGVVFYDIMNYETQLRPNIKKPNLLHEEDFRILKTNFSGRPVGHRLQERITAHFLICYTALLLYQLLEVKLEAYCEDYDRRCGIDHTNAKQRTHFTIDQIVETLRNMKVVNVEDRHYMSTYTGSKLCTALNSLFELGPDKKYYLPKELNKKMKLRIEFFMSIHLNMIS